MGYFLLCLWAFCFSLACIGTGWQVLRLLRFTEVSWPLGGAVGLSIIVFAGGYLNLAGLVNRPTLIAMVVVGNILFLAGMNSPYHRLSASWAGFRQQHWFTRVFAVACVALLLAMVLQSLTFARFSKWDDMPAYLSYPSKLIQLGSLSFDPFSERRVEASLGANIFLQSFPLVAGDVRSMWFIDDGLGLVLFAGCIFVTGRKLKNAAAVCVGLTSLVLILPLSHMNLSMTTLPAAIFAALFLVESADEAPADSRSALLALLAAAVALVKSTYLPVALLILFCLHLLRLRERTWLQCLREASTAALVFLAVLLPWMLDMKRKEGTLFYPLLGRGFEISAYGPVPHFVNAGPYPLKASLPILIVCAAVAAAHWIATRKLPHAEKISLMFFASGLVVLPISLAVGGASLSRYSKPFLLPFALILLASVARIPASATSVLRRYLILGACTATLIVGMAAYGKGDKDLKFLQYLLKPRQAAIVQDQFYYVMTDDAQDREIEREAALQSKIPPGQAVYAAFLPTFAMNFQRNPIYLADFAGMSSLPPGLPTQGTPDELRSYLLSKSIRYIAYSRKMIAVENDVFNWPASVPGKTWPRTQSLTTADVNHQILALAETCASIYDDGDDRVLDLGQSNWKALGD